jgi:hypothetical protein
MGPGIEPGMELGNKIICYNKPMETENAKHGPKDIENVANILLFVVKSQAIKLAYGTRKREEIREKLKKGIKCTDYRAGWLMDSRSRILDTLAEVGNTFNARFPHDCASVQDFVDILQSTMNQLIAGANRKDGGKG